MTPAALGRWLEADDSREVGLHHEGDSEAVGHHSEQRIVEVKRKQKADMTDYNYLHMRKVVGYVHRRLAQGGQADDKAHSR